MTDDRPPETPPPSTPHDDGQRATGVFLIILSIFTVIVGIYALPAPRLLLLVPLGLGLLPATFLIPAVWKWRHLRVALIPMLCLLMLVCGFVIIHKSWRNKPTAGSAPPETSRIAILHPQDGAQVKQCPMIDGTGSIPPNMGLWIVVVPDAVAATKAYWIESQAKADTPDSWSATSPVSIGARGIHGVSADIYAVLLDRHWSAYFAKSSADAAFWARLLPPHRIPAAGPVTVTRVAEPSGASCTRSGSRR